MTFQDQQLPCDACGGTFPFTAQEAAFFAEKGFSAPKRCAGARRAKKQGVVERYQACPFGPDGRGQGRGPGGDRPARSGGGFQRPQPDVQGTGVFLEGVVTSVNVDRGFGFIQGSDGRSYFFDAREVASGGFEALRRGLTVRFEKAHSPRGPRARAVETA
ncbi:MAG: zinc-ribbon domain containing protein [Candidatus Sericytochromatia bacterium]|nr:zinc-ribbon domain containing protein [Candidatus Sericytochromatia bacterium]